jgi:hypothetical protein
MQLTIFYINLYVFSFYLFSNTICTNGDGIFAKCLSQALDKKALCRVSNKKHSVKKLIKEASLLSIFSDT